LGYVYYVSSYLARDKEQAVNIAISVKNVLKTFENLKEAGAKLEDYVIIFPEHDPRENVYIMREADYLANQIENDEGSKE